VEKILSNILYSVLPKNIFPDKGSLTFNMGYLYMGINNQIIAGAMQGKLIFYI